MPLVSIITVCLNNVNGIEKTIQSVLHQTYPEVEYIAIDGGSTDGTREILEKYRSTFSYCVSEKDRGISHAFNKGIQVATGDWIAFLNSGDFYLYPEAIADLVSHSPDSDVVYGGILYQRRYRPEVYPEMIRSKGYWERTTIPHQSTITSRRVFDSLGLFSEERQYCMDYELFFKAYLQDFRFRAFRGLVTSVNCEGVSHLKWRHQLEEFKTIQRTLGVSALNMNFYYWKRFLKIGAYQTLNRLGWIN